MARGGFRSVMKRNLSVFSASRGLIKTTGRGGDIVALRTRICLIVKRVIVAKPDFKDKNEE